MWNNNGYPGQHHHRDQYGPPPGPPPPEGYGDPPPPFPSFPSAGGPGYSPSYAPPSQPSPYGGNSGYGPPGSFAPPQGPPPNMGSYPGSGHHHHQQSNSSYGGPPPIPQNRPQYAPPSGPPPRPPTQQQYYGPQYENRDSHQIQQPYFQYSQCNGRKKALCIGINYRGQSAELKGCINDARNVQQFLISQFGYKSDDIVLLTDDARNQRQVPTKENMIQAMQWLVRNAQPNDSLFFHYSGHGGQTKDLDGDEADGYDEVIYPVDFDQAGHIVDDLMFEIMVRPLPAGCRLTAIFDSCHSGSCLDLPYIYSTEGKIKEPNLAAEAGQGVLSAVSSYARGDMGGVFKSAMGLVKTATGGGQKAEKYARATRTAPCDAISWSGCKDSQTSADTFEAGQATGAMSYAFMSSLRQNPQQSYQQLLNSVRDILKAKYSQKPQLSSSHPMDTNLLFIA